MSTNLVMFYNGSKIRYAGENIWMKVLKGNLKNKSIPYIVNCYPYAFKSLHGDHYFGQFIV